MLPDGTFCFTTLRGGVVILERDGRIRRTLDKDSGLQSQSTLVAYYDREGALWLGLGNGLARVDINSPISIFTRDSVNDVIRHNGSDYIADAAGGTAIFRLVPNSKTGIPSLQPVPTESTQAFWLLEFKDPTGKDPHAIAGRNRAWRHEDQRRCHLPGKSRNARTHARTVYTYPVPKVSQPGFCGAL